MSNTLFANPWGSFVDCCFDAQSRFVQQPIDGMFASFCATMGEAIAKAKRPPARDTVASSYALAPDFAVVPLEEQFVRIAKTFKVKPSRELLARCAELPPLSGIVPEDVISSVQWMAFPVPEAIDESALPHRVYWQAIRTLGLPLALYYYRQTREGFIVPEARSVHAIAELRAVQKSPVLILPVQIGGRVGESADFSRGTFAENEFGLPSYALLSFARIHRDIFAKEGLGLLALGERYAPAGDGCVSDTPAYRRVEDDHRPEGELTMGAVPSGCAYPCYAGVSAFSWK